MKITMLGYTSSGKTTYLSSLLGLFYQGSVNDFSFRAYNDSKIVRLIDEIGGLYNYGTFPDATAGEITKLHLALYKGLTYLTDFEFIDYRGGALLDIAQNINTEATSALETTILASDVVLVFIDAVKLNEYSNDIAARANLGVLPITTVLSRAKREAEYSNKKIRVIFVLTKTDASTLNRVNISALKLRVKSLYSNLYVQFGKEADDFTIFDIGTVGKNCVNTTTKWEERNGAHILICDNKITNMDFRPYNVASVFAQALLEGANNTQYNTQLLAETLLKKEEGFGRLKNLLDILFNNSNKRLEIRDLKAEIDKNNRLIYGLKNYTPNLIEIIESRR